MNEELMFKEVKELCMACGVAIDKIAKDTNINQTLVAKMFMEVMNKILKRTEEELHGSTTN